MVHRVVSRILAWLWPVLPLILFVDAGKKMDSWGFWDWLGYATIAVAAVVIAIDTAIAQSEGLRRHVPRFLNKSFWGFVPLVFILIGSVSFAYKHVLASEKDILISKDEHKGSPNDLVQSWGQSNNVFYMVINSMHLDATKATKKLYLINRANYINIDRMTDSHIHVGEGFTVVDGLMTVAANGLDGIQANPGVATILEFDLVSLPAMFTQAEIKSLSDVQRLGGRIWATTSITATFEAEPPATNRSAVCPPTPKPLVPQRKT